MTENVEGNGAALARKKTFFSLKWKISLLVSLMLLAVVVLFCTVSYLGLMANFENRRDAEYQRYIREMDTLIQNSSSNLRQIAEMIPFLDGMEEALYDGDKARINQAFESYLTFLQIQNGIELVSFYDKSNQLIASGGNLDTAIKESGEMSTWINYVNSEEQPIIPLICEKSCMQFSVTPLLVRGDNVGVAVLGTSLADALLSFKQVTGDEIGLFINGRDDGSSISAWNVRVSALTNKNRNIEILKQAALKYPDISQLKEGVQIVWKKKILQLKLFPLFEAINSNEAHFIVITDITRTVQNIRTSIWQIAFIGLIGLVVSGVLLLLIFTRLLSRLKDIAFMLPLLARGNFKRFRATLFPSEKKQRTKDEVDVLYEAASTLSYQLEGLEEEVSSRTKLLIKQKDELGKERDFIANLLDTAQVIVLTQSTSGKIISLNAFGEKLIQYTEEEIIGMPFLSILETSSRPFDLPMSLEEIYLGKREQFQHEALTNCKDATTRHVAWLHSRLEWSSENEAAILSVGLDVTEYKRVEGHLAWLADHDPLTNLYNRRRFSEELGQVIERVDRYAHTGALLYFDLDRFKYINDTSGHQAGDELLKMVSSMLSRTVRSGDITGRLGGDEFAVILPETNADAAIEVAKKILGQLKQAQLTIDSRTHRITASIGIALFPKHGNNVHDLLAAADLAMYQAKETGRGAWHLFSNDDQSRERMHTLVYWKENIESAHLNDDFLLYLQPIVDIKDRNIVYYEVLLRMRDKDGMILSPTGFIPAAEHTGLIHAIDHMVLRKAIAVIAKICQGSCEAYFSINLSAHSFNDPELLPLLNQELSNNKVDPKKLVFEITETAALENLPGARHLMKKIKKLGCGFVLDDFGVGFSSFYYLRELPVDAVKLDGSFIRNLVQNPDDQILVKALCSVARGFGKKITAEYVENEKIFELIKTMDVDYMQGYFVGKPAPYSQFFPKDKK